MVVFQFFLGILFSLTVFAQNSWQLNTVEVNSRISKQSQPLILAPGNFTVKDQSQMQERVSPDLNQLLQFEPNIDFNGGPRPHAELPRIRGLGAERILILDEGVRQNFQTTHSGRLFSDFTIMENIEVVKGPWSALYGSGALGGVLSFQRSTAADLKRRHGQDKTGEISLMGQTGSQLGSARITYFNDHNQLISYRQSENQNLLLSTGQKLQYSAAQEQDLYIASGFKISEHQDLMIKANQFKETTTAPLNPTQDTTTKSQIGVNKLMKQDIVFDYTFKKDNVEWRAKPYFRSTELTQQRLTDQRLESRKVDTTGLDTWVNHSLKAEDYQLTTTLGAEVFQDINQGHRNNSQTLSSFPNAKSLESGIYLQPTLTLFKKWSLSPGLRYDQFSREPEDPSLSLNSGNRLTKKFYVTYLMDEGNKTIFAGWGEAFRSPRLQDIYVNGLHFPGFGPNPTNFFNPNPNLKPELAETAEIGTKQRFSYSHDSHVEFQLTGFKTQARDFIFQNIQIAQGQTEFINFDRVDLTGLEAMATWQKQNWTYIFSYGETKSRNLNTQEPLADTSADQWNLQIHQRLSDQIKWGLDSRYVERQDLVPTKTQITPEYYLFDIFAQWQTKKFGHYNLRLSNLMNRSFTPHGSFIAGPARNLQFNWSLAF